MADHGANGPFAAFQGFGDFGSAFHFTEETTRQRKHLQMLRGLSKWLQ